MTTQQVAEKLIELCSQGKALEVIDTLYSPDIVSVESMVAPDGTREVKGLAAIHGKAAWWVGAHEIHSARVEGPLVSDARFCVRFIYDITHKESGRRMTMDELAIYVVKDGKIVREEFFYAT